MGDRIVAKAYYNEKEARDTCMILIEAVGYMHKNNVAHRDLKPENLLLVSKSDDSEVKIADFGFAKKVYKESSLVTQCGTPGYVAPEILEGQKYDQRADMWSVGVILYILLGGYPPFIENTWITGDADTLAKKGLDKNLQSLKKFNAKRKFKAAVSTVVAVNKLNSLGSAFKSMNIK